MTKRAWMPLYVADYLADTAHLTAAEHGAYLMLIMHYWNAGSLPCDDKRLARIARMSPDEWADARDTIAEFFDSGWRHKRIEAEIAKADDVMEKRSAAGRAAAEARANKRASHDSPHEPSNDDQTSTQSPSPSQEDTSSEGSNEPSSAGDPAILADRLEREAQDRAKRVVFSDDADWLSQATGKSITEAKALVGRWGTMTGGDYVAVSEVIERCRCLDPPIRDPVPWVVKALSPKPIKSTADRIIRRMREQDETDAKLRAASC